MRSLWGPLLLALGLMLPTSAETFHNPRHISIPSNPAQIGSADFNGDGRPDFYYLDATGLNVLLTNADGSYKSVGPVAHTAPIPGSTGVSCHAADLNGDGFADAVCFTSYSVLVSHPASVSIFLGNGDGTFSPGQTIPISTNQSGADQHTLVFLAIADINSDGHADIVFQDVFTNYLYTWFGDGTGAFQTLSAFRSLYVNSSWGTATVVDLNDDGHPDLAYSSGPLIMLGNGDGTFTVGGEAIEQTCQFADVDKDGHVDAVCARVNATSTHGGEMLEILHGNGTGGFDSTPVYSVSYPFTDFLYPLGVRDLNGDDNPDIIGVSADSLVIFYGKPGAQFSAPVHYAFYSGILEGAASIQEQADFIADFNQDGHVDLAMPAINGIDITYGRADGTFDALPITQSGNELSSAVVADFNEDGRLDVLTSGDPVPQLNLGKGDGTFASSIPVQSPTLPQQFISTDRLLAGDFNGDGHKDILVSGWPLDHPVPFLLFLGNGDGTFHDSIVTNVDPQPAVSVDLNGDGRDDLVSAQGSSPGTDTLTASLSNGDGTFTPVTTALPDGIYVSTTPVAADFNKDGHPDLVVPASASLSILLGHGDGSFDVQPDTLTLPPHFQATTFGTVNTFGISAVATGDFDHDGNPDIAVLAVTDIATGPSAIFVYYGDGHGGFTAPITAAAFDSTYSALQSADLNGDGLADLVLAGNAYAETGPSGIAVVNAQPGRTFSAETDLVAGPNLTSLAVADFNRDGQPDILIANSNNANSFVVLQNQGDTSTTLTSSLNPSIAGESVTFTATVSVPPSLTKAPSAASTVTLAGLPGDPVTLPVTFASNNGVIVGTATYQTSSLVAGSYTLIASFSGNNEVNPSTSAPLIQVVNPAPSYTLTASPTTLQFAAGASSGNASTISVNSFYGFTGNVTLACSVAAGAGGAVSSLPTCSFSTSTLAVAAAGASTQLVIATTARASAATTVRQSSAAADLGGGKAIFLCGVFLLVLPRRLRSRAAAVTRMLLVLVFAVLVNACGGSGPGNPPGSPTGTPAGSYTITVTATSNTATPAPAPVTVALTVE